MQEWLDYMGEIIDKYGPIPDSTDSVSLLMLPDYDW
jgi:hypothetical protein